jgi:hypothetical protein
MNATPEIEAPRSRVFLPHPVLTKGTMGGTRWKFDIERIQREYGEVICCFDNPQIMVTYDVALHSIAEFLRKHEFRPDNDYFLAAGDMTVYASMMIVAAQQFGGTPRQLRHNREIDAHDILPYRLYEGAEAFL